MSCKVFRTGLVLLLFNLSSFIFGENSHGHSIFNEKAMSRQQKNTLRVKTKEMFDHVYGAYLTYAYPADELMPLSCKGRYRDGIESNRGDLDEAMGNYSLTMIDTLDTLFVMGDLQAFEHAVKLVVNDVSFDRDVVVSVFEVNIRVLGGLLSAHFMALIARDKHPPSLSWYNNELLEMSVDVGSRLLPAFDTPTGIPLPRVNLKRGNDLGDLYLGRHSSTTKDTCSACAGTMILEFAALSRLTNNSIYEEKASKAMDAVWMNRDPTSNLVGNVLNVESGEWIVTHSGVGAGIDSYYEYVAKAYILLGRGNYGDDDYLHRWVEHYKAIKKYIVQGPLLNTVFMSHPKVSSRNYIDSLGAFWPGLQVLMGDVKSAIHLHEILYQVVKKYKFLPEAITTDFQVYWSQHLLRPEFIESTYLLYEATKDPHYLHVGKFVLKMLEDHALVPCGFATLTDVRNVGSLDDRLDSFVLAETFKYLYLLFSDDQECLNTPTNDSTAGCSLLFNVDEYIFTTEAHFLPLTLANLKRGEGYDISLSLPGNQSPVCPALDHKSPNSIHSDKQHSKTYLNPLPIMANWVNEHNYVVSGIRHALQNYVEKAAQQSTLPQSNYGMCRPRRNQSVESKKILENLKKAYNLSVETLDITDEMQLETLTMLGIHVKEQEGSSIGKFQLTHHPDEAATSVLGEEGAIFMLEIQEYVNKVLNNADSHLRTTPNATEDTKYIVYMEYYLSNEQKTSNGASDKVVQIGSDGLVKVEGRGAMFGPALSKTGPISGFGVVSTPRDACTDILNDDDLKDKIIFVMRGNCLFIDKVRNAEKAGARAVVVYDVSGDSGNKNNLLYVMNSDENETSVSIPSIFISHNDGMNWINLVAQTNSLVILTAHDSSSSSLSLL